MTRIASLKFFKSKPSIEWLAFLFIFSVLLFIYMRPAVMHCGGSVIGDPGDGTAGGVWRAWIWHFDHGSVFETHTSTTSFPVGESVWQPIHITALAWLTPLWFFSKAVSAPCAWNLTMALGMVLTAAVMFYLVKWLTRNWFVAVFASLAYTFTPYRQMKLQGHVGYVHAEGVLLFILATFKVWEKPNKKNILLLGIALAYMAYTDGYYILIGAVLVTSLHLSILLYQLILERKSWKTLFPAIRGAVSGLIIGGILAIPVAYVMLFQGSQIKNDVPRQLGEIDTYGARLWEYLIPVHSQPMYGSAWFKNFRLNHLHGSNPGETAVYLGIVIIMLSLYTIFRVVLFPKKDPNKSQQDKYLRRIATVLTVVGLLGIWVSLPAHNFIGKHEIPGISHVIFLFLPIWRVYSRLFILVDAAAVLVAAIGLYLLIRNRSFRIQGIISTVVIAACLIDQLTFPPLQHFDYGDSPNVYKWLAAQPVKAMAEYPMNSLLQSPDGEYFTYQPVHGKAMVNARDTGVSDGIQQDLAGLEDPDTAAVLNNYGVKYIIVHPGFYGDENSTPPAGYTLIKHFTYKDELATRPSKDRLKRFFYLADYYNADVYEVPQTAPTDSVFSMVSGFYGPEIAQWKSSNWMQKNATTEIVSLGKTHEQKTVTLDASVLGVPKPITIKQGSKVLWSGTVGSETQIRFTATQNQEIDWTINAPVPPASAVVPNLNDGRNLGLQVSNVDVS